MDGRKLCLKDPLAAEASEKHSLKRQLHAQAVDWCMCAPCFNYVCPHKEQQHILKCMSQKV